jgi:hypothetical protein
MVDGRGLSSERKKQLEEHFDIGRIYTAKIKDNRDPNRNGSLRVWIKESNYDETNVDKWITVRFASPFWGTTPDNKSDANSFQNSKKSYGMWFVPPDIGNYVLICFVGNNDAFWFSCVPESFVNNMVPGIPAEKTFANTSVDLPAVEYNRNLTASDTTRPSHDSLSNGLINQGLYQDDVRGRTTSSARREAPSRTHGILTPRGQQFIMDDGWTIEDLPDSIRSWLKKENRDPSNVDPLHRPGINPANRDYTKTGERHDEGIRLRTRSGAQILISETYGHIYFISRDGESWLELNNDGNIDIYGTGSLNIHTETDINLRADRDLNFEAGRNINAKAAGGNIKIESTGDTDWVIGGNQTITVTGKMHSAVGGNWVQQSTGSMHLNSGSSLFQSSSAATHIRAGGNIIQSGAIIHLNGPAASPANEATAATAPTGYTGINIKQRTSTANPTGRGNVVISDRIIDTISPRVPTHEPWAGRGYENPPIKPNPKKEP